MSAASFATCGMRARTPSQTSPHLLANTAFPRKNAMPLVCMTTTSGDGLALNHPRGGMGYMSTWDVLTSREVLAPSINFGR